MSDSDDEFECDALAAEMSQSVQGNTTNDTAGAVFANYSPDQLQAASIVVKYAFLRASHQYHQFIFSFKEIRNWLLDGGHKMYKVEMNDEVKAWLAQKLLPLTDDEDTNDAQITYEETEELVLKFWPMAKIEDFANKKILPIYKPHKWYLFMIGSPTKAPGGSDDNCEKIDGAETTDAE